MTPGSDLHDGMPDALEPAEAEETLRELLRGRAMVFELGLEEADFRRFRKPLFMAMRLDPLPAIRRRYPALLTTYMSMAGTLLYDGEYWAHLHPSLKSPDEEAGRHFIGAAQSLGLETFDRIIEQESAFRWVSRILAQGGIPRAGLGPFAELVMREADAGATDGSEVIASWRARDSVLRQLHTPTRRFLLYGGAPATDLVGRCLDLIRERQRTGSWPTPSEAGLPAYVVAGFENAAGSARRRLRHTAGPRLDGVPRPEVQVDPYDGLGPVVHLPTVGTDRLSGAWRVSIAGRVERIAASAYASSAVRVPPLEAFEVEFLDGDGQRRIWTFEPLGKRGLAVFSADSGALFRDSTVVAADEAWVLVPTSLTLRARSTGEDNALTDIQELPRPSGAWSGFQLRHLDLRGVSALVVGDGETATAIAVTSPRARPELDGVTVGGVRGAGGLPVFAALPHIAVPITDATWQVQVLAGGSTTFLEAEAPEGRIELPEAATQLGRVRVRVRGALGSDRTLTFVLVPGLRIERPRDVVLPGPGHVFVRLSAPDVRFDDQQTPGPLEVDLRATGAQALVTSARRDNLDVELHIDVPVLRWSIVHDTKPALEPAANRVLIDAEEFDDHLADLLLVDCGQPGVELELELCDREERVVLAAPPVITQSSAGRWSFDLGRFADSIRAAQGGRLALRLRVDGRSVFVADIVRGVRLTHLSAVSSPDEVTLRFGQQTPVPGRVARLWSRDRPWEEPIAAPVPDGELEISFPRTETLPPGPYLAEIAVEDPWTAAIRPSAAVETVRPINVGERPEWLEYLEALDDRDPRSLITWALARYHGNTAFETSALLTVSEELAATLLVLLAETGAGQGSGKSFTSVASLATAQDTILASVLDAVANLDAGAATLARLSLRLFENFEPTSDPLSEQQIDTVWRVAPAIAARLDTPWADRDELARERCCAHLGWDPTGGPPATSGARLNQLELQLPAEVLRDLPFALGIRPEGWLSPAVRQLATFDWLQAQARTGEDDSMSPSSWYFRHKHLRDITEVELPADVRERVTDHLVARTPTGAAPWAKIPVVLLAALVHVMWPSPVRTSALAAVEESVDWATRAITADMTLLAVAPVVRDSQE